MKIGDLVRCRARNAGENYDAWLGLIIEDSKVMGAEYKKVQWVSSDDHNTLETVNHKAEDLVALSENR